MVALAALVVTLCALSAANIAVDASGLPLWTMRVVVLASPLMFIALFLWFTSLVKRSYEPNDA